MKVAVIGEKDWVKAFEVAGAVGFPVKTEKELKNTFNKVVNIREYGVVILCEKHAEILERERGKIRADEKRLTPLVVVIPSFGEAPGYRRRELIDLISIGVGAEVKM